MVTAEAAPGGLRARGPYRRVDGSRDLLPADDRVAGQVRGVAHVTTTKMCSAADHPRPILEFTIQAM